MLNKKIIVECPLGIHLRPAGAVSENASRYHSKITFEYKEGKTANAKSMLSILAAGIKCDDEINLICDGPDELEALEEVIRTLKEEIKD